MVRQVSGITATSDPYIDRDNDIATLSKLGRPDVTIRSSKLRFAVSPLKRGSLLGQVKHGSRFVAIYAPLINTCVSLYTR